MPINKEPTTPAITGNIMFSIEAGSISEENIFFTIVSDKNKTAGCPRNICPKYLTVISKTLRKNDNKVSNFTRGVTIDPRFKKEGISLNNK